MTAGTGTRDAARRGATALAVLTLAAFAEDARATRYVSSPAQFQHAVAASRSSGGRIVLLPGRYARTLVVGPRSPRRLTIEGAAGARIHAIRLEDTQAVTVRGVLVRPIARDGGVLALRSRGIVLTGLRVTARRTAHRVSVDLNRSNGVVVARSSFAHCGDRGVTVAPCLFPRWASHVTIRQNWFHDCRGCDAIHGRAGRGLVVEENRFDRALACSEPERKCFHQDPIELFLGDGVVIRRNMFGRTGHGRGQIFLSQSTHHVRIVNNVFLPAPGGAVGTQPLRGVVVGSRISHDVPRDVSIVNNTILSADEQAPSIVVSPFYETAPLAARPLLANNVLSRLRSTHVCRRVRRSTRNVARRGGACSAGDRIGDPLLTPEGRPTAESVLVVDRASATFAPPRDHLGSVRVGPPDVGAYEFVP